jgi:lipopolysaccharide export LptBFGC system permease protein LptF
MENRLWIILGILALVSLLFALLAAAANGIGFAITSNHAREVLARFER